MGYWDGGDGWERHDPMYEYHLLYVQYVLVPITVSDAWFQAGTRVFEPIAMYNLQPFNGVLQIECAHMLF